eukprot:m.342256 g.342256  ORF g.342256 m.342256 type:complete len:393 (-) comp21152_c0_seq1:98-1276(-)
MHSFSYQVVCLLFLAFLAQKQTTLASKTKSSKKGSKVPDNAGHTNNVPDSEIANYTLLYSLDIEDSGSYFNGDPNYDVSPPDYLDLSFDRVSYYLELYTESGEFQYVWVSFDNHTSNEMMLGVPTYESGAAFQQTVSNMNVYSNVPGVTTGTGLTGFIEFWPTNYIPLESANVTGANSFDYDASDTNLMVGGYGSMQIHNFDTGDTILGFNRWGLSDDQANQPFDLGIGNSLLSGAPDWTQASNADTYTYKRLQVFTEIIDAVVVSRTARKSKKKSSKKTKNGFILPDNIDFDEYGSSAKSGKKTSKKSGKSSPITMNIKNSSRQRAGLFASMSVVFAIGLLTIAAKRGHAHFKERSATKYTLPQNEMFQEPHEKPALPSDSEYHFYVTREI